MYGDQINTLDELKQAAINRRSVVCPALQRFKNPVSAAFAINMQGFLLARMLRAGMYVYIPKHERKFRRAE